MHCVTSAVAFVALGMFAHAAAINDVLAKMDKAAPSFSAMSAALNKTSYTKVIDDKTQESGSFVLRRTGPRAMQVLVNLTKPDPRIISFAGKKAEIYYPKLNSIHEYDLGKQSGLVDQFMLVGFGTTGNELASAYDVKLLGEESIAGQKAYRLELTPKSPEMKEKFTKIEIWISESGEYPVQQRFVQPSGDSNTFTYTGVKLNPPITDADLKLKTPKGTKRERPAK